MIAAFAQMCATARRSKQFTMYIEIPGDENTKWFTRAQVARILFRSPGNLMFDNGEFARMKGERGRLNGTMSFVVIPE